MYLQIAEQTGDIATMYISLVASDIYWMTTEILQICINPCGEIVKNLMAGVAQLVELWIVIPVVEGSSPFARPSFFFYRQNIQ